MGTPTEENKGGDGGDWTSMAGMRNAWGGLDYRQGQKKHREVSAHQNEEGERNGESQIRKRAERERCLGGGEQL